MEVLMLVNNSDDLTTNMKRVIDNSNQKLIITNNTITLTQHNSIDCNEQIIAEKDKSLIWNLQQESSDSDDYEQEVSTTTTKTLNMIKYASLFKNYEKIINSNDNVYYALCDWKHYETTNSYMFVKIISSESIKHQTTKLTDISFGDLFSNVEIIFELYLCHEM
jgi:hypothetical protein